MDAVELEVRAILDGWTLTTLEDKGPFWTIAGVDPYGTPRAGSRDDALALARDLAALAQPAPEPAPEPASVAPDLPSATLDDSDAASDPFAAPAEEEDGSLYEEEAEPAVADIYDIDELATPEQAEEAEPLSIEELVRSGTMLTEDEFAMRVGILSGRIEQFAQDRIAAKYDANARADMLRDIQNYINKGALGIHTTPDEDAAYARANEQNTWITSQEAHARQLRQQLPSLSLDMLRAYKLEEAGWP